jgi:hypothetical protein
MKKILLTLSVISALTFSAAAQTERKSATKEQMSPEQRAEKESGHAMNQLGLDATQKAKFKQLVIDRINANKPLQEKAKATSDDAVKQSLHAQMKANGDKFYAAVEAMLNDTQKTAWATHKAERESKKAAAQKH